MERPTLVALALATALLAPATAFAAARAELSPGTELAVGSSAQLAITIDGDADQPPAPRIDGAAVGFRGQTSRTSIVNGTTTQQTTFIYSVVPSHTGALDVPAIRVATAAGVLTTEPIHATVTDAPSAPAQATSPAYDSAPGPEPTRAFITLELPTKSLVVGQAVPIKIRAYFRGGTSASLEGLPHLTSDAFTLAELSDKPAQTQLELHGEPYLQATWTALLAPAKPSAGKLAVELPVELAFRSAARPAKHSLRDVFGEDPFGDSFFKGADPFNGADPFGGADPFAGVDLDSMFDVGPMQHYKTTLRGTVGALAVTELPTTGKPAGFTGAVGQFAVALDPIAGEPRVGEPLAVAIRVTGTGNFDRVALPGVPEAAELKTYPVKSSFAPTHASKLTGTKTFTQTIVPTRAGELTTIPALTLAYFDPTKHAYVTAETKPQVVPVAAARGGGTTDPGLSTSVRDPALIPNRLEGGHTHATLQPLVVQRRLWTAVGGGAALTLLLVGVGWSRRSPRVAQIVRSRRVDRAVARASTDMSRALRADDRPAFFTAARTALQTRLAASWNTAPDAITAHDVAAHLGERGAAIRAVFEQADGVTYASQLATTEPLDHWQTIVRTELANLETAP